jgi:sarcosine oxidase
VGLDRFPAAHDRGSSHGQTRIIRKAYFEHPDYVPLLKRTYELWASLEEQRNERLYRQTGLIEIGPADGVVVPGVLASARQHALDVEELSVADVSRRFPGFQVPEDCRAVFEPQSGYLLVERCVLAHLEEAKRLGASHRTLETVTSWSAQNDHVEVKTDKQTYSAGRLVIAAGAWATQLLNDLRIPMRVVRKHLHWFANTNSQYHQQNGCPTFFCEMPEGYYYGFPQFDDLGVKVAEHSGGDLVADPLCVDRTIDVDEQKRVIGFLSQCLPGVSAKPTHHSVCMYTLTQDEHFVLDVHPQFSQVAICAGLSGHGFKFTPVLGEILADLVLLEATSHPIEFLSCRRSALQARAI